MIMFQENLTPSSSRATSLAVVSGSVSRLAGGLFQSVRHSARALHALGLDVQVYGLEDAHSAVDRGEWQPLAPQSLARAQPKALGFAAGLETCLDQQKPDLVHQHGIWMGFSHTVHRWARRHDRPVVISPRGMLDPWALRNAWIKKAVAGLLYERRNLRDAAVLHALNATEARALRSFGITQPIAVIPNGVTLPDSDARPGPPRLLPQDGRRMLLYLGRLHPKKRAAELMKAWAILCDQNDPAVRDWRLVVAGWGDAAYVKTLRQIHTKAGLGNRLILSGAVYGADKASMLAHASGFVLPSLSEGLPMAVLEAWAFQCPAFLSAACNLPEGVQAGAAVQIATDTDGLVRDLRVALQRPDLEKMGAQGYALVQNRFCWKKIAADLNAVYAWRLRGGPAPPSIQGETHGAT